MRFVLPVTLVALLFAVGCATPDAEVSGVGQAPPALARPKGAGHPVPAAAQPISLDGRLDPEEWLGLDPSSCLKLTRTHDLEMAKQPSQVWLMRDRRWLYVGVRSQLDPSQPLRKKSVWGDNDGVERQGHHLCPAGVSQYAFPDSQPRGRQAQRDRENL